MKDYGHSAGSFVSKYENGNNYIDVLLKTNKIRRYSYFCTGKPYVDEMQKYIMEGSGLWHYIYTTCEPDYESEWQPKARLVASDDAVPFPDSMKKFDVEPYLSPETIHNPHDMDIYGRPEVYYNGDVAKDEEIPGLKDFIRAEATNIAKIYNTDFRGQNEERERLQLCIELSPYKKWHQYNDLNDFELIDTIRRIINRCPYIEGSIINKLKNILEKEPIGVALEKIEDLCDALLNYEDVKQELAPATVLRMIQSAIDRRLYTETVSGLYSPSERKITIFYRVLNHSNGLDAYLADLRLTLSHELLHYFHHRASEETFCNDSENNERVKEALADFFSVVYCADNKNNIWRNSEIGTHSARLAKARHSKWKRMDNSFWPYAYALYFMRCVGKNEMAFSYNTSDYDKYGSLHKFRRVMEVSGYDMNKAYNILINTYIPRRYGI